MRGNTNTIKEINTELIRNELKHMESGTKNQLSSRTGLSVATCRNILQDMLAAGEIHEIELADSTGGRPSKQFVYNRDFSHALLIYLRKEGTVGSIFIQVIDSVGTAGTADYHESEDLSLKDLDRMIGTLVSSDPVIRAISIGIPGVVHHGVIDSCDIDSFTGIPIEAYLSQRYQVAVTAENDMNTTALGAYFQKGLNPEESSAYIYFPRSGFAGAGIIVGGRIIHGKRDFAGELSHLPGIEGRVAPQTVQDDAEAFAHMVSQMVQAVNCVINPARVMLSGIFFSDTLRTRIQQLITEAPHAPKVTFCEDIHDDFIHGLKYLALKELSYQFEITRK